MPWIRLVLKAFWGRAQDALEDSNLIRSSAARSQASSKLDLERFSQHLLHPAELLVITKSGKVVTMDNTSQIALSVE